MSEHRVQQGQGDSAQSPVGYLGATPPLGQLPPKGQRTWVDRPELLVRAVDVLKQFPTVAIDAEFTQVRTRKQGDALHSTPRLALLQLAVEGQCFVVDALRLNDLSLMNNVTNNAEIANLLHGAGADLRVMAERGLTVAHYYDLEAVSRALFGQNESSLAAMLWRAFGLRLDKTLQRTDWTRRPLPPAMIAYAARDAEVTLALYSWLDQHYHDVLQLYSYPKEQEMAAMWIEPFLRGAAATSPEVAVAEALAQGLILNEAQIVADCRAALQSLVYPPRRSRLLRLIADLSLVELAPDIEPLLGAPTADERAASARALGRLGIKAAASLIQPLLTDPVQDVRKAAQNALRNLDEDKPRYQRLAPTVQAADGTRSWVVETNEDGSEDDEGWKAHLRSLLGE